MKKIVVLISILLLICLPVFAQEEDPEGDPYSADNPEEGLTLEDIFIGLQEIPIESIEAIIESADNPELLLKAVEILKANGSAEAVELLVEMLAIGQTNQKVVNGVVQNDYWQVRVAACIALGELGTPEAVDALINTLINDSDLMVKAYAAYALGMIGDKKATQYLITMLERYKTEFSSKSAPFIYMLVKALGDIGDPEAFAILLEVSQGSFPGYIKQTAIESIKKIQSS